MGKRKRQAADGVIQPSAAKALKQSPGTDAKSSSIASPVTLQIITGSYERTLHGFIARIPPLTSKTDASLSPTFVDSFLFNAHSSSLRCLALSPRNPSSARILLATGSADERINLYSLSTRPPPPSSPSDGPLPASLASSAPTAENPDNRPLGSLLHHTRTVNQLHFTSRAKLLSASDDMTVGVTRTRDWTLLSSIRAPAPKPTGRPFGDTLAPGDGLGGLAGFAVHPSGKVMLSVGRAERCMRLWNLVTGKKAGVLNFDRAVLRRIGEAGDYSRGDHRRPRPVAPGPGNGEARAVEWAPDGETFAVAFERGVVVYGVDCAVRTVIAPRSARGAATKVHRVRFLPHPVPGRGTALAVATEDGRVLFYAAEAEGSVAANGASGAGGDSNDDDENDDADAVPECPLLGQLPASAPADDGGRPSRIKDFAILPYPRSDRQPPPPAGEGEGASEDEDEGAGADGEEAYVVVTAASDGAVRLYLLQLGELELAGEAGNGVEGEKGEAPEVGMLLGAYETGTRITCLTGFVMDDEGKGKSEEAADVNGDGGGDAGGEEGEQKDDDVDKSEDDDDDNAVGEEEDEWGGIEDD